MQSQNSLACNGSMNGQRSDQHHHPSINIVCPFVVRKRDESTKYLYPHESFGHLHGVLNAKSNHSS